MLTVFNNGVGYPLVYDDYYIRELASGLNEIIFNVSVRDEMYRYITEEAVIRDRDEQTYLIKQIDAGEDRAKVVAQINLDDWKASMLLNYSNNSKTVSATITEVAPQGWAVVDQSMKTIRRTIPQSNDNKDFNVTPLSVVMECCEVYSVRVRFDNKNKIIYIIDPNLYTNVGAFATRDLNLRKLNYKGKSDNFVTRLYAVGADGLTFASINDGKPYVENFTYSNKLICAYWEDNRYTDAQSLLDDATERLAEMAKPSRSYDCDVLDLAKTNPEIYNFENFSLFNVITLVDDVKQERFNYQIVERWDYPYYPAKNKIVLASVTPNIQSVVTTIVNSFNNPTSVFSQKLLSTIMMTTQLITGNKGGYLILKDTNGDDYPDELLIMDTADIATATQVWRWNKSGLGYSGTGYQGPYTLGMNMLGQINASMISTGSLDATIITAGILRDANENNYWNLETGEFRLSAATTVGGKTVSKIAEDEAAAEVQDFITNTYNIDIQGIEGQIDGKAETFYQSADPSTAWTTTEDKDKHVGDLWYRTTDDTTWYYQKSGNTYQWVQQNVPKAVFDDIDGKAQVFLSQPTTPYDVGDIWFVGTTGDILTCITAKPSGSFNSADWEKRNKYTDDSALTSFIDNTYRLDKINIEGQIDKKAETWYQSADPSTAWITNEDKAKHVGDLWYKTTDDTTWFYDYTGGVYSWKQQNIPTEVFDEIDGKAQVFVSQPVPPYSIGDIWFVGTTGDILTCVTGRAEGQSFVQTDWQKRNKYTDDSALSTFLNGAYANELKSIYASIDQKAETFYQAGDPSYMWTTDDEKDMHVGDLWYRTLNDTTWYYKKSTVSGVTTYSWEQQNVPREVFDKIDGKAQVFITQPVPPYDVGDIWFVGTTGDILTCVNGKAANQSYAAADWEKRNKYTDNSELTYFIQNTYKTDKRTLENQIDKKAETWYQSTDPSTAWTTVDLKAEHVGDLWYNTTNGTTWYYASTTTGGTITYAWEQQEVPTAVFDKIDGKAQIFVSQPTPPYNVGDLWFKGTTDGIYTCMTAKTESQSYAAGDWVERNNYVDSSDVSSAITEYDTNLNQLKVFNKLTNNGQTQGIFLDNGLLYINGEYIRAGSIDAGALSVSAREAFNLDHNYLPYDIFENVGRWEINAKAVDIVTQLDVGHLALELDGTDISSYTASYQTQVKTSLIGNPTLHIKFKYQVDRNISISTQQFFYIYYKYNGSFYTKGHNVARTLTAFTEYEMDVTWDPAIDSSRSMDPSYSPRFGFRFFPGCITYIYDLEVTGTEENYKSAKLQYTVDGLDSTVQKGSIISNINQSAEQVSINASKIDLTGNLHLKGDFTADSSQYSNVRAEIKDGELYIIKNSQVLIKMNSAYYQGTLSGYINFFDENGNSRGHIGGGSSTLRELIISNSIIVNGLNDTSHFYREVIFHGADNSSVTFDATVYNHSGGVVFVSDRRKKKNIKDLVVTAARSFIMALKPKSFKFKKGEGGMNGKRYHHGFIAQEVKEALGENDWGVYCENKETDFIGLRYDEFLADMVAVIQDQQKRIEALERRVDDLTNIQS